MKRLNLSDQDAVRLCAGQLSDSVLAETALRRSGPLAVESLIAVLVKKDLPTRLKAARLLGEIGEPAAAALPALTTALRCPDPDFRLAVAKAIWNVGKAADPVVPVLIDLLEDKAIAQLGDADSRRRFVQTVIEALWRIGPPAHAARPALEQKAKDKNRLISESAQGALSRITGNISMGAVRSSGSRAGA